ncbi:MAG: Tim44/TimA family putative adaptor protein [Alphaproteobacteria bacterium]|jgi:predicted lipid-binding transport protein (Tim44 family)|nr:Tim44 domain-containing protein [Candidatus Scatocola faecigallinarum]
MAAYLDIIILLVVVVLVFSKLKSLLGTRPDNFEQRKISDENAAKIFDMIVKEAEKNAAAEVRNMEKEEVQVPEEELSEIDKVLAKIPGFNREKFLTGAERAFEIIISAFSKGDVETLEMLVSKSLLKKFQEIIEKRKAEGITSETDFIGFDDVEITNAKISKSEVAKITVRFVSEQVNILKNKDGEVIEGDENFIQNITDSWTFERALTSTNPNWLLVSTKK